MQTGTANSELRRAAAVEAAYASRVIGELFGDSILVYRGISGRLAAEVGAYDRIETINNGPTSWSLSRRVAERFAEGYHIQPGGVVLETRVQPSEVLTSSLVHLLPCFKSEMEVVIMPLKPTMSVAVKLP